MNLQIIELNYILFADEASKFDYRVDSPDEDFLGDLEDALDDNELANVQNNMAEPLPEPGLFGAADPVLVPAAVRIRIRFLRRLRRARRFR